MVIILIFTIFLRCIDILSRLLIQEKNNKTLLSKLNKLINIMDILAKVNIYIYIDIYIYKTDGYDKKVKLLSIGKLILNRFNSLIP